MSIFLISDLHLDHEKIVKYCRKQFRNVHKMNTTIIKRWNSTVTDRDTVYFLGDFCNGNPQEWLDEFNGNIQFIRGNHDKKLLPVRPLRERIALVHKGEVFLMSHRPPPIPESEWVIHGHVHNHDMENYPLINLKRRTMNVSAELLDYYPIELNDLLIERDLLLC